MIGTLIFEFFCLLCFESFSLDLCSVSCEIGFCKLKKWTIRNLLYFFYEKKYNLERPLFQMLFLHVRLWKIKNSHFCNYFFLPKWFLFWINGCSDFYKWFFRAPGLQIERVNCSILKDSAGCHRCHQVVLFILCPSQSKLLFPVKSWFFVFSRDTVIKSVAAKTSNKCCRLRPTTIQRTNYTWTA